MFKSNSVHDVGARGKKSNPSTRGFNIISNTHQDRVGPQAVTVADNMNIFGQEVTSPTSESRSPGADAASSTATSPRKGRRDIMAQSGTKPDEYSNPITMAPVNADPAPVTRHSKPKGLDQEAREMDDPSVDPISLRKKPEPKAARRPRKSSSVSMEFVNPDAYSVDPITLQPREGRVTVVGLHERTTDETLRQHFAPCGGLKGVSIVKDDLGFSRGIANVIMENTVMAQQAIERFNGTIVDGRKIRVDWAKTKNSSARQS